MKTFPRYFSPALLLLAGSALLVGTGGCMDNRPTYRSSSDGRMGTAGVYVDDYDYFPGYETYYSRSRHEYYYREGRVWVTRPQPRGIAPEALQASPSVRMDFHDAPPPHHDTVVKNYPKDWKRPPQPQAKPAPRGEKEAPKPAAARGDGRKENKDKDRQDSAR